MLTEGGRKWTNGKKHLRYRQKRKKKEIRSIGVQASEDDIINEREIKRLEIMNRIMVVLESRQKYEELADLADGNQIDITSLQDDCAMLVDPNNINSNKIIETLMLKYNGLSEMIKNSYDQVDYLIQTFKVKTRRNEHAENRNAVYLLPMNIDTKGINHMDEVYKKMDDFKEIAKEHSSENIAFVVGDGLKISYIRKICEHVFRKENIKIKLLLQGRKSEPQKQKMKKQESIVTVRTEGKSYVDMVKKLKQEVDITKIGVKIKKIRKTIKGDLLLAVEGGKEMASTLETEIKCKIDDVKVSTRTTGMTTLYIMGIEPTTSEDEIKQALTAETQLVKTDVTIKSLRKGKYDEQTAIVEVPTARAIQLTKRRRVKIGWVECGIKERVHVDRCFKCLEYGHMTRECTAEIDRRGECIKCGLQGHKSKDRVNKDRCVKCSVDGH